MGAQKLEELEKGKLVDSTDTVGQTASSVNAVLQPATGQAKFMLMPLYCGYTAMTVFVLQRTLSYLACKGLRTLAAQTATSWVDSMDTEGHRFPCQCLFASSNRAGKPMLMPLYCVYTAMTVFVLAKDTVFSACKDIQRLEAQAATSWWTAWTRRVTASIVSAPSLLHQASGASKFMFMPLCCGYVAISVFVRQRTLLYQPAEDCGRWKHRQRGSWLMAGTQ